MSAEYPPKKELEQRRQGPDKDLLSSGPARRIETGGAAHRPDESPTGLKGLRSMSGALMRLAARLGRDPDELAETIPLDTIRRTKYPVVEERQADGSILFKHIPVK